MRWIGFEFNETLLGKPVRDDLHILARSILLCGDEGDGLWSLVGEHLEDRAARRKQTLVLLLQLKIAAPQLMSQCVYFEQ